MRRSKPEPEALAALKKLVDIVGDLRSIVTEIRDQHPQPPEVHQ